MGCFVLFTFTIIFLPIAESSLQNGDIAPSLVASTIDDYYCYYAEMVVETVKELQHLYRNGAGVKKKNKTVTTSWQCGRERIQKRRRGRETGNQKNNASASRCMNNGHEDLLVLANKDGIVGIFFSSTKSNDRIILP